MCVVRRSPLRFVRARARSRRRLQRLVHDDGALRLHPRPGRGGRRARPAVGQVLRGRQAFRTRDISDLCAPRVATAPRSEDTS
eukprot:4797777-Pleurochrysis_carterae.AAC.1